MDRYSDIITQWEHASRHTSSHGTHHHKMGSYDTEPVLLQVLEEVLPDPSQRKAKQQTAALQLCTKLLQRSHLRSPSSQSWLLHKCLEVARSCAEAAPGLIGAALQALAALVASPSWLGSERAVDGAMLRKLDSSGGMLVGGAPATCRCCCFFITYPWLHHCTKDGLCIVCRIMARKTTSSASVCLLTLQALIKALPAVASCSPPGPALLAWLDLAGHLAAHSTAQQQALLQQDLSAALSSAAAAQQGSAQGPDAGALLACCQQLTFHPDVQRWLRERLLPQVGGLGRVHASWYTHSARPTAQLATDGTHTNWQRARTPTHCYVQ